MAVDYEEARVAIRAGHRVSFGDYHYDNLLAIIDIAERAEARLRAADALAWFAEHKWDCAWRSARCDCGLAAARDAYRRATGEGVRTEATCDQCGAAVSEDDLTKFGTYVVRRRTEWQSMSDDRFAIHLCSLECLRRWAELQGEGAPT